MPLIDLLPPPIAYQRVFRDITGGVLAAIMLGQLIYWQRIIDQGKGGYNGWVKKEVAEFWREIGLSRYEQATARKQLISRNLIEVKKQGVPPRLHYRVDWDTVDEALERILAESYIAFSAKKNEKKRKNNDVTVRNDEVQQYIDAAITASAPDDPVAYSASIRRRLKKQGALSDTDREQLAKWQQTSKPVPQIKVGDVIDYGNFRQQIVEIRGNCVETQSGEIVPLGPIITSIISRKAKLLSHS